MIFFFKNCLNNFSQSPQTGKETYNLNLALYNRRRATNNNYFCFKPARNSSILPIMIDDIHKKRHMR